MNYLVDPINITNYDLNEAELQRNLLWWVFAAGHNALSSAKGVEKFLTDALAKCPLPIYRLPFNIIHAVELGWGWDTVVELLGQSGLGCWQRRSRTVKELADTNLSLKTCTAEDLEAIWGIGKKTSHCFLLHSREGYRRAGLDRHILSFLRDNGIDAPKSTPTEKKYKVLEKEFLRLCDEAGKTPAEYDLEIWNKYRK